VIFKNGEGLKVSELVGGFELDFFASRAQGKVEGTEPEEGKNEKAECLDHMEIFSAERPIFESGLCEGEACSKIVRLEGFSRKTPDLWPAAFLFTAAAIRPMSYGMKKKATIYAAVISALLFSVICSDPVFAAGQKLGSGYSCNNKKIFKSGKTVKLAAAKAAINTQIGRLGKDKKSKAKKAALNALKTALANCAKGTGGNQGGGTGPTVQSFLDSKVGKYEGNMFDYPISDTAHNSATWSLEIVAPYFNNDSTYHVTMRWGLMSEFYSQATGFGYLETSGSSKTPYTLDVSKDLSFKIGTAHFTVGTDGTLVFDLTNLDAASHTPDPNLTEIKMTLVPDPALVQYTGKVELYHGATIAVTGTGTMKLVGSDN
jgi:hypothetical protein